MSRGHQSNRHDVAKLQHFVAVANACKARRGSKTIRSSLTIGTVDGEEKWEGDFGDEEDNRALVTEFRKFISESDDAFFPRICGVLERRVEDQEVLRRTRTNRDSWLKVVKGNGEFMGGIKGLPGDKNVLNVWINGVVFHNDAELQAFYLSFDPAVLDFFHLELTGILLKGLAIVNAQRHIIEDVLDRNLVNDRADGIASFPGRSAHS